MLKSPAAQTPRDVDLEKGNGKGGSSKAPKKGWLAEEKEVSRSSSQEKEANRKEEVRR
jgi:hypothetical protein